MITKNSTLKACDQCPKIMSKNQEIIAKAFLCASDQFSVIHCSKFVLLYNAMTLQASENIIFKLNTNITYH